MYVIASLSNQGCKAQHCCGMVGCVGLPYFVKQSSFRNIMGRAGEADQLVEARYIVLVIC